MFNKLSLWPVFALCTMCYVYGCDTPNRRGLCVEILTPNIKPPNFIIATFC